MPKMKTHSSSKKRLSVTGAGKVKKNVANRAHKLKELLQQELDIKKFLKEQKDILEQNL